MATLSDIVNVQIALNTAAVARATFDVALIASPHASFSERVRTYTDYDAAVDDNLPPLLLTALSDAFAQTPHPRIVKVGRLGIAKVVLTPADAVASAVYSVTIGTSVITATADSTPTKAEIATALASAINTAYPGAAILTAAAVSDTVEIVYTTAAITPIVGLSRVVFSDITPATSPTLAAELTSIKNEDNGWYVLHMTERTKQRVLDAAEWTEAQEKLFVTASAEAAILDPGSTTDLVSALRAAQYFRTAVAYSATAGSEYPDVAWASRVITIQPGGETWALKRLASVSPSKISATERNTIISKGGNTFEFYQPQIALTTPGKVAAGEWLDIIRFRDYLKDLIQTNMVMVMINRDKVPYTDAGLQLLGNNLKGSLRTGQTVGGIAPDEVAADGTKRPGFFVVVPLASEVDDVTKASRVAYLRFGARIAGAVHMGEIQGALSYSIDG